MSVKQVNLDDFVAWAQRHVDEFAAYYRRQQRTADVSQFWPDEMPMGEWFEQLVMFDEDAP
jgi:hypothetical protein